MVLAIQFRARGNRVLTGLFLGFAILTKFYPLVLFPALYQRGDWKMPAVVATVAAAGYATYSSVGMQVFGFLGGYTQEEGITTGARYFLLQLAQSLPGLQSLSTTAYLVFCAVVFLAITAWAWTYATTEVKILSLQPEALGSQPPFLKAASIYAFALMLLFSPHYPWYVVWLVPFFALGPTLPLLTYLIGFFYLFTTKLAIPGPGLFILNKILYGCVFGALLVQFVLRRLPLYRGLPGVGAAKLDELPRGQ
jgi:hypothetical protein